MQKPLRRQDIIFEQKDQALRDDVSTLGRLVGELLKEQGGDALYEFVEDARIRAIRRREGNEQPGKELDRLVRNLDIAFALEVVRSFSTYFQMVNTAEKVHRIRRRREYLRTEGDYQPGGLEDTFIQLKAAGLDLPALQQLLDELLVEPVFTAHPTEPTRRTMLRKEQNIVRWLVEMLNPTMTEQEIKVSIENIKLEVTTGWQTEEHPSERMTVADELEHVLFFVTDVLYRAMPPFYEHVEHAAMRVYGDDAASLRIPLLVRFASWVGGDMDGNPNVNAKTIRSTMARQRSLILDLYYRECAKLSTKLSQSTGRIAVDKAIMLKIEEYTPVFQQAYHAVPARHRDMPYRVYLRLIQQRLQATYDDEAYPYESADELRRDIELIAQSLANNKGQNAGLFAVKRLLRRIETFGFHLVTLDVRQDAMVHREVIGEALGDDQWLARSPEYRLARIGEAIRQREPAPLEPSTRVRKTLAVFHAISFCRRKYGRAAIGPFIVSMTQGADDILSVLLLAQWGELHNRRGEVPLDIAPLLETVDDLERGPEIMQVLLSHDIYRDHVNQRGGKQMVMIGYSDSNKDSGFAAARWALQHAQVELAAAVAAQGVELQLFHGRGGTLSRGGGKTHNAVLAAPPGTVKGRLRVTEQGEIINEKYGLRGIALRTLEQATGAVALVTTLPEYRVDAAPGWQRMMQAIADASRQKYRELVYETPQFYEYFRKATPIDLIERMRIGSRPAARRGGAGVAELRAIPWVFAWTQSRFILPGWYGLGSGLRAAAEHFPAHELSGMCREWYFARLLVNDAERVLAQADLTIACFYSELAGELHERFFPLIRGEFELTRDMLLECTGQEVLLESDTTLQRSIMLRNPYVDPMSLMQVDLLARWRKAEYKDDGLLDALFASVNGIAQGLQNTG